VHRAVNLCQKYCGGKIPNVVCEIPFDIARLRDTTESNFAAINIRTALESAMECVRETNRYITERAPWQCKDENLRAVSVRTTLEAVYIFAHFLSPYIPTASELLFSKLHTAARPIKELSPAFNNLAPGTPVDIGDILFAKVALPEVPEPKQAEVKETLTADQLEAAVTAQGAKVRQMKEV
jgi:methionyl-tRNA synthetase